MKRLLTGLATALTLSAAFVACDDTTTTIGSTLIKDQVEVVIDSTFVLTGHSVESNSVQSRTVLQLLGAIDNSAYGAFRSDIVTQFMPVENIDTTGVSASLIDSVKLIMRIPLGGFVGDSLAPMGVTVYPLTKALPAPIYSSFDPEGYYDPSRVIASTVYTMTAQGLSSETYDLASGRYITMDLDREFGKEFFDAYLNSPNLFSSPSAFTAYFPGMYIRSSFGRGSVAQIDSTVVSVYYRQKATVTKTDSEGNSYAADTIYHRNQTYMAVTPEIVTNNVMDYAMANTLRDRAQAGEALLVAPTGYDVEIRFPIADVIEAYRNAGSDLTVVNTLGMSIPVTAIGSDFGLTPPPYVLMVKKSEKDKFFAQSKLPDNRTSFYATYNNYYNRYDFSDMRQYLLDMLEKESLTADDMDFIICPVTIGFEQQASSSSYSYYYYYYGSDATSTSSYVVGSVTPYINKPAMARLDIDKARITFTYSVQKLGY